MPENSLKVINSSSQDRIIPINRHRKKKVSTKFNKPHCIIPVDDIQWVVNQTKTVQTLWNECWASDQYGSRWMKLVTSLGEKTFRLARQLLYTTGLFEFKRETCTDDTRKTACWLVKNLHGARRIKEFWMQDDQPDSVEETAVKIDPISGINEPDNGQKNPNDGQKIPDISPETPEKSSLPDSLSNSSLTSQELLKEVPVEVIQELELAAQVPTLEEMISNAHSRDSKKGDQYARFYEYCLKKSNEPQPDISFRESFITTYQWKIDDQRFRQLLKLSEDSRRLFFEKFENMYGIYRTNLSGIFDHLMRFINQKTGNSLDC